MVFFNLHQGRGLCDAISKINQDSGGTLAFHNPKIKVKIEVNDAAYLETLSYYCLHNMYIFYTILQMQFTLCNRLPWEV